jgi:hypothetical protein
MLVSVEHVPMASRALPLVADLVVAAGVVAAVVLPDDGQPSEIRYASAPAMAAKSHCAQSFRSLPAPSPVRSSGECQVLGVRIEFAVTRDGQTALDWQTGIRRAAGVEPGIVGDGWAAIIHTGGAKLAQAVVKQVSGALSTP